MWEWVGVVNGVKEWIVVIVRQKKMCGFFQGSLKYRRKSLVSNFETIFKGLMGKLFGFILSGLYLEWSHFYKMLLFDFFHF